MNTKTYTPLPNRSPLLVLLDLIRAWGARANERSLRRQDLRRKRSEYISLMNMPDYMLYDIGLSRDQVKDAYIDTFRMPR